jgi:hypothetical protein
LILTKSDSTFRIVPIIINGRGPGRIIFVFRCFCWICLLLPLGG